ncbi:related to pathway-specific nitrogen regulator [Phialocephala subalpina]|uniref:Related to pathway-specific nitrogen regulator n=1 Tax=Phialocephala subalpina TaxID=576137 RepID=A0A1L7WVT9_9HELO|nr:related to pathway-specific nitrogen regulator [Phialocephala subalpina]
MSTTSSAASGVGVAVGANSPAHQQPLPPPKQIRFVNNEGQPPAKRRRINAAAWTLGCERLDEADKEYNSCRTCRKRKTRCDGKRPLCSTCTENGHDCLGYADGPETGPKKERKTDNEISRRNDDDDDVYDDEDKSVEGNTKIEPGTGSARHPNRGSVNGSPELRRVESNGSYFGGDAPRRRNTVDDGKGRGSFDKYRESAVFSDDGPSPLERSPPLRDSHRVPYFRYFGPTAIVPGFKQMVVFFYKGWRRNQQNRFWWMLSVVWLPDSQTILSSHNLTTPHIRNQNTGMYTRKERRQQWLIRSHVRQSQLFRHFYYLLMRDLEPISFLQRVEEKSAEPILVDAVCSLAARFSDHPLITQSHDPTYPKSEYGHVYAQRAKAAVVDTFPCPTVAAVQAFLLLAYEGFGANQDSALWMYLGCAIRMAVDLGLQKLDGVKHQGQKDPGYRRSSNDMVQTNPPPTITAQEMKDVEQERIDTLWAVFMLDRVISSGTGRPVTLRDEDFELTFPEITANPDSGWPNPFPALIQIIHLYGRVSDLLNNIRDVQDVTPKKIEGLSGMEKDLTQLYQKLDQRLTFNAANFQHYVKSGEGTNFILVHFWFHTLIMLLHQPTLMHSFEGQILSLLPNSRELSMSSAKTIADILAFAELIDPRSFIGNPFTSQPMYIAACAFLMESAAHTSSQPTSRDASPPRGSTKGMVKDIKATAKANEQKQKHTLLASAANQNYQRCYKALQQLETYWAGTRYILVALDQKAKGIWDPETYTEQEYESTKIRHDMIPGWQKKLQMAAPSPRNADHLRSPRMDNLPGSPAIDPAQAIGWSLTGTTNSPSSNLTFMYQNMVEQAQPPPPPPPAAPSPGNMIYDPIRQSLPEATSASTSTSHYSRYRGYEPRRQHSQPMPPPAPKFPSIADSASTSDAEMLLGLQNSPYSHATPNSHHSFDAHGNQSMTSPGTSRQDFEYQQNSGAVFPSPNSYLGVGGVGDMMMESQEIDMSTLGGDMMPWLEYLPQDVLNFFDNGNSAQVGPTMGGGQGNGGMDGMGMGRNNG